MIPRLSEEEVDQRYAAQPDPHRLPHTLRRSLERSATFDFFGTSRSASHHTDPLKCIPTNMRSARHRRFVARLWRLDNELSSSGMSAWATAERVTAFPSAFLLDMTRVTETEGGEQRWRSHSDNGLRRGRGNGSKVS